MKSNLLFLILICFSINCSGQYNSDIKIEKVLVTDTTSMGQKILYPQFTDSEVTILKISIPPGATTGWHLHTIPVFAYILKGTLTVDFEDGRKLTFKAGNSIAEVINRSHKGTNNTEDDVELIAIYLGEKGKKLSIPVNSN
jgi:quercetin dioxygenase-like cupin family protein